LNTDLKLDTYLSLSNQKSNTESNLNPSRTPINLSSMKQINHPDTPKDNMPKDDTGGQ